MTERAGAAPSVPARRRRSLPPAAGAHAVSQTGLAIAQLHPGGLFPATRPIPPDASDALVPSEGPEASLVRVWLDPAACARGRMEWERAAELALGGAAIAREHLLDGVEAEARHEAAAVAFLRGDADAAASTWCALEEDAPSAASRARARLGLALARAAGGDAEGAMRQAETAEAALLTAGDVAGALRARLSRAVLLVGLGRLREGGKQAREGLRDARRAKDAEGTAAALMACAVAALAGGARAEARAHLGEAVRAFARACDALRQVQCHFLLGEIAYEAEDPIRAGTHYRGGLGPARQAGWQDAVELLSLRFEHR